MTSDPSQAAIKDEGSAHPVASEWRPVLRQIVTAIRSDNYALEGVPSVFKVDATTQKAIQANITWWRKEYGETLAELPDETWKSSISQWMGTHWEVLVDLWTNEAGKSDLVLNVLVYENERGGYRFEVLLVYVP